MPDLLARIWDQPDSVYGPLNNINNRKPSSLDFDESPRSTPRSMSSLFTPPAPIGWHLKKPNSPEKVNTYRAFANSSPPAMAFQGEANNDLSVDQTTPQDYLSRYQHLKTIESYKNELIEDLLYRCGQLTEQVKKATLERENDVEYLRTTQRREALYQENIQRLQDLMDADPFVLILIDLTSTMFHKDLIDRGENAGVSLQVAVREHIATILPELDAYRVVIRAFGNLTGLEDYCQKAGMVDSAAKVKAFTRGFTKSSALCDFVDVAGEPQDVISKISETFQLHLNDYHCRQIVLCCSNDDRYSHLLQQAASDQRTFSRVTLLEGEPYDSNISDLPFETIRFKHLLEAKAAFKDHSPLTRQLSNLDVGDIKEFTPSSTPSTAPRPPAIVSLSAAPSPSPSPVGLWASIAAKPAAPVVPPPATTPSTPSTVKAPSDGIPRNRKGQRIDAALKHEKSEVDRVKKLKMCNTHFLRGFCPVKTCPHVHDYKPTAAELNTLRLVARMAPCMNGGDCDDAKCIYGHMCPAPLQRDGRVTKDGKDCIFQEDCRFEGSRHLRGEDRKEVRFIKVT